MNYTNKVRLDNNAWYLWLVYCQDTACKDCLELDGKVLLGKNIPTFPLHPNCRCGCLEVEAECLTEMVLQSKIKTIKNGFLLSPEDLTVAKSVARISHDN